MGAIVFRKKKIISAGYNIAYKPIHPAELPMRFRKFPTSAHAEINALLSARCSVRGASIIVVRINNSNKLLDSFPCQFCMAYLQHVGIRRVIYSTSRQEILEFLL